MGCDEGSYSPAEHSPLVWCEFNAVDGHAYWNVLQWQRVAWLDGDSRTWQQHKKGISFKAFATDVSSSPGLHGGVVPNNQKIFSSARLLMPHHLTATHFTLHSSAYAAGQSC